MHANLFDALEGAARTDKGVYFVASSDQEVFLPYRKLREEALAVLAGLQARGVQPGDEVVFQYVDLKALMVTFWACVAGGIVPVPLEFGDQANSTEKVFAVWRILANPWLATDSERMAEKHGAFAAAAGHGELWQAMQVRLLAPLEQALAPQQAVLAPLDAGAIAFIQFSSGSTGTPKGVTMTHTNLLTNIGDILASIDHAEGDRFLTWKPITHDFGMIAFHLAPVVAAGDQVRISTDAFVWNPTLWFAMVHKYRASILGSPNFGYRHFLKLFRRGRGARPEWDLSCVKVILNGAEPISEELCIDFIDELAAYGMPRNVMTPGYGLAEGSLISSLCRVSEPAIRSLNVDRRKLAVGDRLVALAAGAPHAVNFVDCGLPYPNTAIRITDAGRHPLPEQHVGRIEIRGASVTAGYYRNPEASNALIDADGWLDTQDLGALVDGRLLVVGRTKEMLIIGGVNYFPHDIEQGILRAKGENELNKYIAAGMPDPANASEAPVVFVYYKRADGPFAPLAAEIAAIVQSNFGLTLAHVVPVAKIPKTTSGKVQRYRLVQDLLDGKFDAALAQAGAPRVAAPLAAPPAPAQPDGVFERTRALTARLLGKTEVDADASFFDLGLTSLRLLTLKTELETEFDVLLDSTSALDFPTVRKLAERIRAAAAPAAMACATGPAAPLNAGHDIAIVGIACRFPGNVHSPDDYWKLLSEARDPVRAVPAARWAADPQAGEPLTTREGGFLDNLDQFDPLFFGIAPAEALAMDPQQRLLLEVAHEAIENAGWSAPALAGTRTAVFVGISGTEYGAVGRDMGHATGPYTFTGSMFNTAAGRLSYTFGLQGPSAAVDTACSSSLVALHQGVRELRAGSSDAVIAGGVNLILKPDGHVSFSRLNALAASGRCRSFDDAADGYIRGEGCGVVILKRLCDAERDGDTILAVIKGAAVNHNGRSGGLTVPSGTAQERLIVQALADAGMQPSAIDYVEAHGSGTRLGDPQELGALSRVFHSRQERLRIGSVKSNLGHLEAAAGMAGLIKLVMMLRRQTFAPNLHFKSGNSLTDWQRAPLQVVDTLAPWPARGAPRAAGISSFGISGTNAHLVLQEYLAPRSASAGAPMPADASLVFTLSAKTPQALRDTARAFSAADLEAAPFDTLCRTVNRTRSHHPHRLALAAASFGDVRRKLARVADDDSVGQQAAARPVVFLFTGQGSVYPQIGQALYRDSAVFRAAFDRCDALFQPLTGQSLAGVVAGADSAALASPRISQPLIFSVGHALCRLWESLGVRPDIVLGHSIGEYAAACEAGVMTLEAAVNMVALRGAIMHDTPADGAMAGILASVESVRALLAGHPGVHIAAINTGENVTVSGRKDDVAAFLAAARKARIFTETLPISHPFHSPLMQAGALRLAKGMAGMTFDNPRVTLISSQTGAVVDQGAMVGAPYWAAHLCNPVMFGDALDCALSLGASTFLEIGGTAALSGLGAQIPSADGASFLPSMRENKDGWEQLNQSIAALFQAGADIDWTAYHTQRGVDAAGPAVTGLPNTAYQRSSYWFAPNSAGTAPAIVAATAQATVPVVQAIPAAASVADIAADIADMVSQVTGVALDDIEADTHLFSLGIDSLMLAQLDKRVVKRFGVDIPVKLFFAELDTPARIAAYVHQTMPVQAAPAAAPATALAAVPSASAAPASDGSLESIVTAQLDIMRLQLAMLRGETPAPAAAAMRPASRPQVQVPANGPALANPLRAMVLHEEDVDPRQLAFIRGLAARIVAKTPKSRMHAERYRGVLADWIATLNFSLTTKEMAYPVVSASSRGAHFTDIDGNRYVDTATGYGATFFGHNPAFITDAIREQLDEGFELGPQSDIAGEVAELISELTGVQRVAFCNSGTEAVMVAVRLARAVTRRKKFVRFINSYHGSFDGVLADAGEDGAVPVAPGIVASMVEDTVVLHYGTPESLDAIRALGADLAAVLVEPVQSRNPENYSKAYLEQLRSLTTELGAALIFDEMITGFRIHPGGVQAHFEVRADLVTYGKVVGGGMPIGVVAGSAHYMDAIDGGNWRFGDASGPDRETTFFAGTFCKHPLAMAAARAVLLKLKHEGAALIAAVNALTERFVDSANAYFETEAVPIKALRFGSMYRFETLVSQDPARSSLEMNLLFRHMQLDGVYFWERRTAFFSTAHTEHDAQQILAALRLAVQALRDGGFSFRRRAAGNTGAVRTVPASFPLSSEERRMYVVSLMKGGEDAYHVSGALRLRGSCDPARVEAAIGQLAERHPALRAAYVFKNGTIEHQTLATLSPILQQRALDGQALDEVLAAFVAPFDLAQAPLWRAALIRCGEQEHVLALDFHHLIADGIAMTIMIEDFVQLYHGAELPPAGATYADFVAWEQGFAGSAEAALQRQYWMGQVQPPAPPLELPADFARPAQNDFAGATVRFTLDGALHQSVRELAARERVTPFMVLLSAYFVFLQKLTGQDDLCVGTPFDRRSNGNFDRTVGMFAQTLLIRAQPGRADSFSSLLARVRSACTGAYTHPDCSLEEIVGQLNLPRDFSRNPLFDTMFIFENGNRRNFDGAELSAEAIPIALKGSPFDLTLEVTEAQGVFQCALIYATRLFTGATVERWAGHFEHVLAQALAEPARELALLQLVGGAERDLLLEQYNDTARSYPSAQTLCSMFADAAARWPQRTALQFADQSLRYAELDERAGDLARRLRAQGVERGDLVGILLPRGTGMIVSMLAVLKAGAAYVPLDPDYPAARIGYMVEHSRIKVLLSHAALAQGFGFGGTLVDPDQRDAGAPELELEEPSPSDLAYVIFTSGSTGHPKGVMLEHAGVVNFLHAMDEALALPAQPATLGLTTISFDIFVLEVFLTLVRGGALVLASESEQRDPQALTQLLRSGAVEVMQATPSRVQSLLAGRNAAAALAGIKVLLVGGEAFPAALLLQLQAVDGLRIFNVYGPTETTVWSACKDVTRSAEPTLGRPIANTRVYVLDAGLAPRPAGAPGDLYIAGSGLARGYLHDPEKTAAAFIADPFNPGQRMYRTGDRAAWNADGDLVYHGRSDGQIKLRGYRIEIGEIENVLQRHPMVLQAAVAVRHLSAGNPVLVAYYVARAESGDLGAALRTHAAAELPEYMVPALAIPMAALPCTPNGKIDRLALPDPVVAAPGLADTDKLSQAGAPDPLEAEILAVWKQLLGERNIGLRESFFDVGGNSFSLVAMHGLLSEKYPDALEVADIFANPTIEALKTQIEGRLGASADAMAELVFPPDYFDAGGQMTSESLSAHLDGDAFVQLEQLAAALGSDTVEVCFALYLVYLNKLLRVDAFEAAAGFSQRPEYMLTEVDFSRVRNLGELVSQVRAQHGSEAWMARKLAQRAAAPARHHAQGVRSLFVHANAVNPGQRFGFDLVLRILPEAGRICLSVDYDGARLNQDRMKLFVGNYVKVMKALLRANTASAVDAAE